MKLNIDDITMIKEPELKIDDGIVFTLPTSRLHTYEVTLEWQPVVFTILETDEYSHIVGSQMQQQFDFFDKEYDPNAKSYKFDFELEDWILYGAWIMELGYDSLNFLQPEEIIITLTLRYEKAEEKTKTT